MHRRAVDWTLSRSLAANSVTGISLMLGFCAAAWFTAGTRTDDLRGALVLCASYAAGRAAGHLPGARRMADAAAATASSRLLARVCAAAAEYAVYAGLAVGGEAAGWSDTWVLAVTAMILLAIRRTMRACCGARADGSAHPSVLRRLVSGILTLSGGCRVAVVAVAAPIWGARAALFVLLAWAIIVVGYAIGGGRPDEQETAGNTAVAQEPAGRANWAADQRERVGLASLLELAAPAQAELPAAASMDETAPARRELTAPPALTTAPFLLTNVRLLPSPVGQSVEEAPRNMTLPLDLTGPRDLTGPVELTGPLDLTGGQDLGWLPPARGRDPQPRATIAACRDDGRFARYLGRLVRGNLVPLPPALAGLAAAAMLAELGLRNLPGLIVLTPLVVMLLAAPGSSHPHDGRFDWLVPALLQAGQYVYLATLGFASAVAAPVIFALCAMTAIRYAELAYRSSTQPVAAAGRVARAGRRPAAIDIGLGWEGRMLLAGLGAIAGVATFAYLALTAYVGVLICSEVMTSRVATREDVRL